MHKTEKCALYKICCPITFLLAIILLAVCKECTHSSNASCARPSNTGFYRTVKHHTFTQRFDYSKYAKCRHNRHTFKKNQNGTAAHSTKDLTSRQRYSLDRHNRVLLTVGYHMACMSTADASFILVVLCFLLKVSVLTYLNMVK